MNFASVTALLVVLGLLALAIAVLMLILFAQITGWRALSKAFPAPDGPHADRARTEGVVLGAWGWNAPPLSVSIDDAGMWLFPRPPFTVAFRSVRLPWEAVLSVGTRQFMLFDITEVRYGPEPKSSIGFLAGATADEVARIATARGALPHPALES